MSEPMPSDREQKECRGDRFNQSIDERLKRSDVAVAHAH